MRRKSIKNAKLVITVRSCKDSNKIETISVFDNRKNRNWTEKEITERNIKSFLNLQHLKRH